MNRMLVMMGIAGFLLSVMFAAGCTQPSSQLRDVKEEISRLQLMDEEILAKYNPGSMMGGNEKVEDVTAFENTGDELIEGIGVVVGLDDTGGTSSPSNLVNTQAMQVLIKYGHMQQDEAKRILNSPSTAIVQVVAKVPPLFSKETNLDAFVFAVDNTKSLKYGWLIESPLQNFVYFGTEKRYGGDVAYASGPIIESDLTPIDITLPPGKARGIIQNGVISNRLRNLTLRLNKPNGRVAMFLEKKINNRFPRLVVARSSSVLTLNVAVYPYLRADWQRMLAVVGKIDAYLPSTMEIDMRLKSLERKAASAEAVERQDAIYELEALGDRGLPVLRKLMQTGSADVRRDAAKSLTYMGVDDALSYWITAAGSLDPQQRIQAYEYLGKFGYVNYNKPGVRPRTASVLSERFKNELDPAARYQILLSMEKLAQKTLDICKNLKGKTLVLTALTGDEAPMDIILIDEQRRRIVLFNENIPISGEIDIDTDLINIQYDNIQEMLYVSYMNPLNPQVEKASPDVASLVYRLDTYGILFQNLVNIIDILHERGAIDAEIIKVTE